MRLGIVVAVATVALALAGDVHAGGKRKYGKKSPATPTVNVSSSSGRDGGGVYLGFGVAWADACSQWTQAAGGSGVSVGVGGGGMERICQSAMTLDLLDRLIEQDRKCAADAKRAGDSERAVEKLALVREYEEEKRRVVELTLAFVNDDLHPWWRGFKSVVRFVPGLGYLFPGR